MPGRFTGRTAWLPSHPAGTGSHGGLGFTSLGERGAAPTSPYAEADGLVQWAECIALPADYVLLSGLPTAAEGG